MPGVEWGMSRAHQTFVLLLATGALALPGGAIAADMYRWVDERGVVNYSNLPPPATAKATRIADAEPTVSVIPPPARAPEARSAAAEAALLRRIEQLEDELAQLRRAAAPPPVYAAYPPAPAVTYAEYRAPIVYPVPVYTWPLRPAKPHHQWARGGHVHRPVAAPHTVRSGISVSIRR